MSLKRYSTERIENDDYDDNMPSNDFMKDSDEPCMLNIICLVIKALEAKLSL